MQRLALAVRRVGTVRSVLAALWHETPQWRHVTALDVGNELAIVRGLAAAHGEALARESTRLARLPQISDTGSANDPWMTLAAPRYQTLTNRPELPTPVVQFSPAVIPAGVGASAVTVAVKPVSENTTSTVCTQPP